MKPSKYNQALNALPQPGRGAGFHNQILGIANYAALEGVSAPQCLYDIQAQVKEPPRGRDISKEITQAIEKAYSEHDAKGGKLIYRSRPYPPRVTEDERNRLIDKGEGRTIDDFKEASPVEIPDDPIEQAIKLLSNLYEEDEALFIGERAVYATPEKEIRMTKEWISYIEKKKSSRRT